MRSSDLPAVLQIERNTQPVPWSRLAFEESLTRSESDDTVRYVCETLKDPDSCCVAFVIVSHIVDELHIMNLAVATAWQGQGIGHSVLDRIFQLAKVFRAKRMFLEVRKSNVSAITLYEKWGFELINQRPNYYRTETPNQFEDALVYCRGLTKTVIA